MRGPHARFTWRRLPHAAQPINAHTSRPAQVPLPLLPAPAPVIPYTVAQPSTTLHNSAQQDTAGLPARNGGATKQKPSVIDEGLLQTFSRQKQPKDSLLFLAYFLALAALSSLGVSALGAASGAFSASGFTDLKSSFCLFTSSSTSLVTSLLESKAATASVLMMTA